eukprot:753143-Hanusia_phi.AAC.2
MQVGEDGMKCLEGSKSQTRGRRFAPDLRRAIVNMCKRGMAHDEVAKCCNVSLRTVSREKAYDKRQTRPRKTKDGLEQMGDPGLHETLSVDPLGMGSEVDRNQRRIPSRGRPRKMLTRVPSASDSSRPRTQQEMNMRARERSMQQSQMVSGTSGLNNRNSMQQLAAAAQGLPHVDMGWNMQGGSSMPRFGEWSGFTSHSVANQPGGNTLPIYICCCDLTRPGAVGPSNWNSSFSRGAPQQPSQSQWSSSSFSGAGGHFNNVDPGGALSLRPTGTWDGLTELTYAWSWCDIPRSTNHSRLQATLTVLARISSPSSPSSSRSPPSCLFLGIRYGSYVYQPSAKFVTDVTGGH